MMRKYRKKPVVIEADQWKALNGIEGPTPCIPPLGVAKRWWRRGYWVKTLECWSRIRCGDYIVRGVEGELYPCRWSSFEATHEEVGDD